MNASVVRPSVKYFQVYRRFLVVNRNQISYGSKKYANKNIKMSSFKSSENIKKKEGGPDISVSDNQSSSVTLNELAMKARKYCNFEFQQRSQTLTDNTINGVQITKTV